MISISKDHTKEKAVLTGVELPGQLNRETRENLKELEQLSFTAGLDVVGEMIQERQKINPAYFIGSGKVEELNILLKSRDAGVVVFDEDLSPAQIRNLENALDAKIIDRSSLILDIFAKHARSREAKTQVELAQLQYLLPRLTRQWTHLSRQVGGVGTRGPGETQLETDRRLIRKRIEKLRSELSQIDKQRTVRRKNREDSFRAALIGYTNVGKSTVMNLLSGSEVLVQNQLFATLDSTVRRVQLDNDHQILLSDTVGFIRKLPPHLVASFKSTLDEVKEADLLLHVVDIHHTHFREQMQTVMQVLEELDSHRKPILIIFNKIDLLDEMGIIGSLKSQFRNSVFISAARHIGIESLKQNIVQFMERNFVTARLTVPMEQQKFLHYIHSVALVEDQKHEGMETEITFRCSRQIYNRILQKLGEISEDGNKIHYEEEKTG